MSDAFLQLSTEVYDSTKYLQRLEECRPHYQRVLDYIVEHQEERASITQALVRVLTEEPGAAKMDLTLLHFLMKSLLWPEVKRAAENFSHDGNGCYDAQVQHLLEIYGDT